MKTLLLLALPIFAFEGVNLSTSGASIAPHGENNHGRREHLRASVSDDMYRILDLLEASTFPVRRFTRSPWLPLPGPRRPVRARLASS
jgi:hypothetical protein